MQKDLTIIIPSYLEEENLRIVLPRLKRALTNAQVDFEVLVVDTLMPMDHTANVCQEQGVRYVNRTQGNFYGDAVRTGIQEAHGQYIVFMDGDGSHTPEFVLELFRNARDNDVVAASRYVPGGATDNKKILILMSKLVNFVYAFVLGIPCKDMSNSFKLYRASLLKGIALTCNNFDIIEEILFKMKRVKRDIKIKEVPFTFKERMFGHTKRSLFRFMLSYLFTLMRLRFSK